MDEMERDLVGVTKDKEWQPQTTYCGELLLMMCYPYCNVVLISEKNKR